MRAAQRPLALPARLELKISSLPSGDQRGLVLSTPGELKRCGTPPSVEAIQISEWRRFSDSRTVTTVNATSRPSGAIAGWRRVVTRYQSESANARFG